MSERLAPGLKRGEDGVVRCQWAMSDPLYVRYHDREWGFPVADGRRLFEKICLEGFQSGLSWLTILRKREAFRAAFGGFAPETVAAFGARDVARLLRDAGIVRHRGKIEATVNNARCLLRLVAEAGPFAGFVWSFEPAPRERPPRITWSRLRGMATTPASVALSKALRAHGFRFVGPTTVYAFMQAMGLVDDHVEGCAIRPQVEKARRRFRRPASR